MTPATKVWLCEDQVDDHFMTLRSLNSVRGRCAPSVHVHAKDDVPDLDAAASSCDQWQQCHAQHIASSTIMRAHQALKATARDNYNGKKNVHAWTQMLHYYCSSAEMSSQL
jgi:hypothetical protein